MKFTFRQRAGEHERFSENAFDKQLGKIIPVNFKETDDGPITAPMGEARLVGVAIIEDGKVAELTLELLKADGPIAAVTADMILKRVGRMSFSFLSE